MEFVRSNPNVRLVGMDQLPGRTNYFLGNDPSRWRLNIPNYASVLYKHLYPGVNLKFYGNSSQLEFDFVLAPGADPHSIFLEFPGSERLLLDAGGNLNVWLGGASFMFHKPRVYQMINHKRRQIDARFRIGKDGRVAFRVARYDPARSLVIDPTVSPILSYSTYLGGSQDDVGTAVALDSSGNAFLAGYTDSTDFPVLGGTQTSAAGGYDAFVAELNSSGTALVYSTYLGGSMDDHAEAIVVDSSGNAYVTGDTASADFPTVDSLGTCGQGASDAFVAKLNSDGSKLLFATCFGGSQADHGMGIALDPSQNMYVVGDTSSSDFPITTGAFQATAGGGTDAFITEIKADGSSILYSTFLGGSSDDHARAVALNASGDLLVVGNTTSPDFPVTDSAFQKTFGGSGGLNIGDAFVTELKPAGSGSADLVYSTYLGGASDDGATGVVVDGTGDAYVTGLTFSTRFPTVTPFQAGLAGGDDAFVAKLNPAASGSASLVFSTYLGGSGDDQGTGIAVDSSDNVYISGVTASTDFPVAGAFQPANASASGLQDAFYAKLVSAGNALVHSSYLGGSGDDVGRSIAIDSSGDAYIIGNTASTNFPATTGAFETAFGGAGTDNYGDVFITKILPSPTVTPSPTSLNFDGVDAGSSSGSQSVRITNTGDAPLSITSIVPSAPFSESNGCQSTIAVAAHCSINVVFSPVGVGAASGTLSITDNAGGSPQLIPLEGNAVGFSLTASSTTAQVTAGQSANYSLQITPNGFTGPVSLSCSGAPAGASCSVSPSSTTLDGSAATNISVSVSTSAHSTLPVMAPKSTQRPTDRIILLLLLALLLSAWFATFGRRWARLSHVKFALVLLLLLGAVGCTVSGSSSSKVGTAIGTYQLKVVGTSGSFSTSVNLTLTVK
jgi:hypothetical protein